MRYARPSRPRWPTRAPGTPSGPASSPARSVMRASARLTWPPPWRSCQALGRVAGPRTLPAARLGPARLRPARLRPAQLRPAQRKAVRPRPRQPRKSPPPSGRGGSWPTRRPRWLTPPIVWPRQRLRSRPCRSSGSSSAAGWRSFARTWPRPRTRVGHWRRRPGTRSAAGTRRPGRSRGPAGCRPRPGSGSRSPDGRSGGPLRAESAPSSYPIQAQWAASAPRPDDLPYLPGSSYGLPRRRERTVARTAGGPETKLRPAGGAGAHGDAADGGAASNERDPAVGQPVVGLRRGGSVASGRAALRRERGYLDPGARRTPVGTVDVGMVDAGQDVARQGHRHAEHAAAGLLVHRNL